MIVIYDSNCDCICKNFVYIYNNLGFSIFAVWSHWLELVVLILIDHYNDDYD